MDASYVDLADPRHLEFDYLRWMRAVVRGARARRIVHVGGGACALPRALAAEDPEGHQEVCEINSEVLALAREHLGLRRMPGLHVRLADGRAFLAREPAGDWEAVVIDAFTGARIPRRLITAEAFAEVRRVAPLALVNVVDDRAARLVAAVAAGLAEAYRRVWTVGGRAGNTIVVGDEGGPALAVIAARVAADPSPGRVAGAAELAPRIAGSAPLRDARTRGLGVSRSAGSS